MSRDPKGSIPGYKGYIPGKRADGVVGLTYTASNRRAAGVVMNNAHTRANMEKLNPTTFYKIPDIDPNTIGKMKMPGVLATQESHLTRAGATYIFSDYCVPSVPGYAGHVPGKYPETNVGGTFRAANEEAGKFTRVNRETMYRTKENSLPPPPTYNEIRGEKKTQLWGWD